MGNLQSIDFRVVGRCLLHAALGAYFWSTGPSLASDASDKRSPLGHMLLAQSEKSDNIKNIQRLLTLLSERFKAKYGTTDPGRVDGSYGAETKAAIRNYQEIAGINPGSQTNDQLISDILATLAQMSAEQPEEDNSDRSVQAKAKTQTAQKATSATPAQEAVKAPAVESTATTPAPPHRTAPVPPAKAPVPPAAEIVTKAAAQAPAAPKPDRVYFSQLASLRTLEAAQREWQRIFEANRAALNGEQVYFEEAEISGRGTFHRILVGPIPERDAARTLCGFLKQNNQPCVVISRVLSSLRSLKDKNGRRVPAVLPASDKPLEPPIKPATPPAQQTAEKTSVPADSQTAGIPENDESKSGTDGKTAVPVQSANSNRENVALSPKPEEIPTQAQAETPRETAPAISAAEDASKVFTGSTANTAVKAEPANAVAVASAADPTNEAMPAAASETTPPAIAESPTPEDASASPDNANETTTAALVPFSRNPEDAKPEPPTAETSPESAPLASPEGGAATTPAIGTTNRNAPTIRGIASDIRDYAGGTRNLVGFIAVMIVGAAILQFIWWRRNRSLAFTQIFRSGGLTFGQPVPAASGPGDALAALETDFESEQLRQSRSIRDDFLRDILGDDVDQDDTSAKIEPAIRINSSLKSLLISDPVQYKSIFLNWIFLSKVGAALNQQEITMEDLNGHFGREFNLLQNYFKIHLLELDDRHRIRKELPGLFYCLQLAQQRQRQTAGAA